MAFLLAELTRRMGGVVNVPLLGYVVNDPMIARQILLADKVFTKTGPGSSAVMVTQVAGENVLLNMDGPDHVQLRRWLADSFSRRALEESTSRVLGEATSALTERLLRGERVDLVRFMHVLSARVMCRLLGVNAWIDADDELYARMFDEVQAMISVASLGKRRLSDSQVKLARRHLSTLVEPVHAAHESGAILPDSVIGRLLAQGLNFDQIQGLVAVLLMTGTESVSTAFPRIVALAIDSGQLARLRDDKSLVSAAVDEGLRYTTPSPVMVRSVAEDNVMGGKRFASGKRVVILTYNLVKHASHFPQHRSFDPSREVDRDLKNIWFGAGAHFCLGFGLAQMELHSVLGALVDLPGELRIVKRRYARNVTLPAYSRLEVQIR
jgi:cytochrome P450